MNENKDKAQTTSRNITKKSYEKLSQEKKIAVLMHMKNRAKLRTILAVYITKLPFEQYSVSETNLLVLGDKFFEVSFHETLVKED